MIYIIVHTFLIRFSNQSISYQHCKVGLLLYPHFDLAYKALRTKAVHLFIVTLGIKAGVNVHTFLIRFCNQSISYYHCPVTLLLYSQLALCSCLGNIVVLPSPQVGLLFRLVQLLHLVALLCIVLAFLVSVNQRRGSKMRTHRVQQSQITTPTGSIPQCL